MKSIIAEPIGCYGSQKYKVKGEFNSIKEARAAAFECNQKVADGRGETIEDFLDSNPCEGVTYAFKGTREEYDGVRV